MNDRAEGYRYPPRVRFEVFEKELDSYRRGADFLNFNNADVLCVQHEFGIFGGAAGSHLLALLKEVRMPVVTTFHTVLRDPSPAQRKVMEEVVRRSDRVVVMARQGAAMLREIYAVPEAKVDVIPHGIPDIPFADSSSCKAQFGVEDAGCCSRSGCSDLGRASSMSSRRSRKSSGAIRRWFISCSAPRIRISSRGKARATG